MHGKQKSAGTFSTRKEAEKAYWDAAVKVEKGIDPTLKIPEQHPDDVDGHVTLDAYCWPWIEKHNVSHNVRRSYMSALRKWIVPRFGTTALSGISTGDIKDFLIDVDKHDQPSTTRRVKAVMSAMFQAAAEDKNVPEVKANPVLGIKLRRAQRKRRLAFTHPEYEKFRVELDDHWKQLTDFIVRTGLRWEEAMGLKKEDIVNGIIWVGSTMHEEKKPHRWVYQNRTKTGKSRQVPLPQAMAAWIEDRPDGFIFRSPDGSDDGNIRLEDFRDKVWKPALKAVGLENSDLVPRDMRRTNATWLLEAGVDIKDISEHLGHSSIAITQIYLAPPSDSAARVAAAIDW